MYKDRKQIGGCLGNREAQAGITKGHKETCEGEGYILYLDSVQFDKF